MNIEKEQYESGMVGDVVNSVLSFAYVTIYKGIGAESIIASYDKFMGERFLFRLEEFTRCHSEISDQAKAKFYDNLSNNKQNGNYLYEFIEKARTTTYELHAKLLARLSVELVKNGNLNYYESTLLSNINTLNDLDLIKIHKELKECNFVNGRPNRFKIQTSQEYSSFQKALQLGIFEKKERTVAVLSGERKIPEKEVKTKLYKINEFTEKFFRMLDEILS